MCIYVGPHYQYCVETFEVRVQTEELTSAQKNAIVIIGRGEEKTTGNIVIIIKYETK